MSSYLSTCFGHLGCFHVFPTVNNAPMNTGCRYLFELSVYCGIMAEAVQCGPAPHPSSVCAHSYLGFFLEKTLLTTRLQSSCLSTLLDLDQMLSFLIETDVIAFWRLCINDSDLLCRSPLKTCDIPAWCAYHTESAKGRHIAWSFSSLVQATGSTNQTGKPESFQVSRLELLLRVEKK